MGLPDRERGEMYPLLILLVSQAFGRPSSDQLDSGLLEAERNIRYLYAELEVEFDEKYFQDYNEAKSYLGETRQELMEMAHRTVTDVRDLKIVLEHLDESSGSVFLTIFTNRMKDLMIKTGLMEAREKYESAVKTFENLNSFIKTQNRKVDAENIVGEKNAKFNKEREASHYICQSAIISCFGGPSYGPFIPFDFYRVDDMKDRISNLENNFDQSINEANDILNEEIDMISIWNKSARVVSKNIDNYPAEILTELKSVKTIFIIGLDDLKNVAERFLDQPTDILEVEKLTHGGEH